MLGNVSQVSMANQFTFNTKKTENELQKVQNQLSSGMKIALPSDDPVSAVNYMDYDSRLKEIQTYNGLIQNATAKVDYIDGKLGSATEILQRLRELAVQMANGIYTDEVRMNAAKEVDELMKELVSIGNSYYKGEPMFGGTFVGDVPFKETYMTDPKTGEEYLVAVKYIGNNQSQIMEIEQNEKVAVNHPGNQLFWAKNALLIPSMPSTGYTAQGDSKIVVDGLEVEIKTGDTLDIIAKKINDSGAAVKANVFTQNGASYFTLETTSPHQLSLMDTNGGAVLQNLGIIEPGTQPPNNLAPSAKVYSGSIFDVLIDFRKALVDNNQFDIGGKILGGIDMAMDNVLKYRASLGAVEMRMQTVADRLGNEEIYISDIRSKMIDTDMTKAMIDMKMLEFSHDVALNLGARLMPKTLLDFLR
ncbi:MAG: flagellar hook-associated protein 3 [Spirochaetes bacterium GWF1_51_8]|nr:MAG: flagellar hook-associated protein 3 [Spirochaetes bacterium GWF1_51_8]